MLRTCTMASVLALAACSFDEGVEVEASSDADQGGTGGADASIDVVPAFSLYLNIGGSEYVGTDYPGTWLEDDGSYCGGSVYTTSAQIHNTADDPLFQTTRYGRLSCAFSVPNGQYSVTLLLGEVYRAEGCVSSSSTRVFDIDIEGTTVLQDFDLVAACGGCIASDVSQTPAPLTQQFTVTVLDGTLDLVTGGSANSMLSAIAIESVTTLP